MGFLMQVEVDWIAQVIRDAKKPVMTIKPMAAGQLRPFQALNFVWNTLRAAGHGHRRHDDARRGAGVHRPVACRSWSGARSKVKLQETRSKASVKAKVAAK